MQFLRSSFIAAPVLILAAAFSAEAAAQDSAKPDSQSTAPPISFRKDVWPIVRRHCRGCHSQTNAKGGLSMDSVAAILKGGESGALFDRGKPDGSLLLEMITGEQPEMPKQQPPLSPAKIDVLKRWIQAGAKDDSPPGGPGPKIHIPETYRFAPAVTSVAISPDGKTLAAACRSEVILVSLDQENAAPKRLATECDLITHVEFSPDGTLLAAAGGSPAQYGEVRFFKAADGSLVSSRRVTGDTLFRGSFAPDSKSIALGGADGAAHVIPVDPKGEVKKIPLHSDWVTDVSFTADGKMIVTVGRDKSTKIASVETGKLLRTLDDSAEPVSAVATNETFAFASGKARTLIGYEFKIALQGIQVSGAGNGARPVTRRNQYAKNMEGQPGPVLDLATSLDRKRLAIAGAYGDVRVYGTADRARVALIQNVPVPVYGIALNQDGSQLVIGTRSGQVQLYNVADGKLIRSFVPVPVQKPGAKK